MATYFLSAFRRSRVRRGPLLIFLIALLVGMACSSATTPTAQAATPARAAAAGAPSIDQAVDEMLAQRGTATATATPQRKVTATPSKPKRATPTVQAKNPYLIRNVKIYDLDGNLAYRGDIDLKPTLDRIAKGIEDPHPNDGAVFTNRERRLPRQSDRNYYHEYVIRTKGIRGPGPQRLIMGKEGEIYYTPDHYETFIQVR